VVSSSKSHQNGYSANGAVCTTATKKAGRTTTINAPKREDDTISSRRRSFSIVRLPIYCFWLSQFVCRSTYDVILSPFWRFISSQIWILLKSTRVVSNSDEILSVSGDGSLLADEESDQENLIGNKVVNDTTKRRSKRTRGRTPAVAGEIVTSNTPSQQQIKPQATIAPSFASKLPPTDDQINSFSHIHSSSLQLNGQLHEADKSDLLGKIKDKSKLQEKCKCSIKLDELENKLKVERGNWRQQMTNMEHEKQM
jgi:hypothetical protein